MAKSDLMIIENRARRLAYKLCSVSTYSVEDIKKKVEDYVFCEIILGGYCVEDYLFLKIKVEEIMNEMEA